MFLVGVIGVSKYFNFFIYKTEFVTWHYFIAKYELYGPYKLKNILKQATIYRLPEGLSNEYYGFKSYRKLH